jgi:hypothetical protein
LFPFLGQELGDKGDSKRSTTTPAAVVDEPKKKPAGRQIHASKKSGAAVPLSSSSSSSSSASSSSSSSSTGRTRLPRAAHSTKPTDPSNIPHTWHKAPPIGSTQVVCKKYDFDPDLEFKIGPKKLADLRAGDRFTGQWTTTDNKDKPMVIGGAKPSFLLDVLTEPRSTESMGRGRFAKFCIPTPEDGGPDFIGIYSGVARPQNIIHKNDYEMWFPGLRDDLVIDGKGELAGQINHAPTLTDDEDIKTVGAPRANCAIDTQGRIVVTHNIAYGEELLWDYGIGYWLGDARINQGPNPVDLYQVFKNMKLVQRTAIEQKYRQWHVMDEEHLKELRTLVLAAQAPKSSSSSSSSSSFVAAASSSSRSKNNDSNSNASGDRKNASGPTAMDIDSSSSSSSTSTPSTNSAGAGPTSSSSAPASSSAQPSSTSSSENSSLQPMQDISDDEEDDEGDENEGDEGEGDEENAAENLAALDQAADDRRKLQEDMKKDAANDMELSDEDEDRDETMGVDD